jgi:peptide/nickel transport system permease protein
MVGYILRRILQVVPLLIALSIVSFLIIELPPGDYLTSLILRLEQSGKQLNDEEVLRLKKQYGLDRPAVVRYSMWIWNILRDGDFGRSFTWQRPVAEVITERIILTMVISIATLLFTWVVAVPVGIYSAVRQYSPFDYITTFFGFIGLSTPNFLLALILMWLAFNYLNVAVTGLFSPEYADSAWSLAKVGNMLSHIWVPILVIGTGGTAGIIRVMRGCLLDELRKQYVITSRAKGVAETRLLFKYPVRVAVNPLISTIGWLLPAIISGETITSIVLNLPTSGPMLFQALLAQDTYLAASFVLILAFLTIIGTLLSDLLLAWLDPRIRYQDVSE